MGATGKMGSAIAKGLAQTKKYRLLLMANDQAKLNNLKHRLESAGSPAEIDILMCAKEASWEADVIILATPYEAERNIAEKIREVATGKVVISVSNPPDNAFPGLATSPTTSGAEQLQRLLPDSRIVKAFNTVPAANFETRLIGSRQVDSFIAGNNSDAVDLVAEIVASIGLNPVVAGDLSASRTLERVQSPLIQTNLKHLPT